MKAGRRFRTELSDAQTRLAQQTADACRAVYNTGLEQRREYRRLTREGKHWFVSLPVDDGIMTPAEHASPGTAVGVDRGVAPTVFTTAGEQRRALSRRLG